MFRRELLLATALTTVMVGQAFADEYGTANQGQVTIQQAASMMAYNAGSDQAKVSIAPNWSDELGWSVRAAAGSYLGDAVALGAIVEYGQDKQEYLGNLGFQLSDSLSLIGTVGNLAETKEFIDGEGDDKASQMEYGLSLKLAPQEGLGFELNGYSVDAKAANEDIETGKLYGTEALASLGLADTTLIKIGGGYEWLEWDGGEKNDHWTFRTEASQRLTDALGLQGHAKLGASERSYGGGLNLNLSNDATNLLGINYTYIEGLNGIAGDKRVELSWTYGFGAGPSSSAAAIDDTDTNSPISPASDVAMVSPVSSLLGDVMKRPEFLPKRVLARANSGDACPFVVVSKTNRTVASDIYDYRPYSFYGGDPTHVLVYLYGPSVSFTSVLLDGAAPDETIPNDIDPAQPAVGYTTYGYGFGINGTLSAGDTLTFTIPSISACSFTLDYSYIPPPSP